jgi:hypothetical protein
VKLLVVEFLVMLDQFLSENNLVQSQLLVHLKVDLQLQFLAVLILCLEVVLRVPEQEQCQARRLQQEDDLTLLVLVHLKQKKIEIFLLPN